MASPRMTVWKSLPQPIVPMCSILLLCDLAVWIEKSSSPSLTKKLKCRFFKFIVARWTFPKKMWILWSLPARWKISIVPRWRQFVWRPEWMLCAETQVLLTMKIFWKALTKCKPRKSQISITILEFFICINIYKYEYKSQYSIKWVKIHKPLEK